MKKPILPMSISAAGTVLAAVLMLAATKANAADYYFNFNSVFSGTAPGTGRTAPWLQAEIKDVAANTVDLTISATGLQGAEFISDFYLNINPSLTVTNLAFSQTSKTGSFADPGISTGEDAFKADGDGYYDVDLSFATANGSTFTVGDSVTYRITGITGLNANDFDYTSTSGGGVGIWLAAAHVQSITAPRGDSGWIAPSQLTPVPEPAPILLFILAIGLGVGARRMRTRAGSEWESSWRKA